MAWRRKNRTEDIRLGDEGFEVLNEGESVLRVHWADVRGIAAFKRDQFTVDQICLAFRDSASDSWAVVGEDVYGFDGLVREIKRRYPDGDAEWWGKTAMPPFATCWTVIWGDAAEQAECPTCRADISGSAEDQCHKCGTRLETIACPSCCGQGRTRDYIGLWIAIISGLAGAVILLFRLIGGGLGLGLLVAGGVTLIGWLRERPDRCFQCEGTGWWDPRGRAARRIPS